jgi:hypothetical protein
MRFSLRPVVKALGIGVEAGQRGDAICALCRILAATVRRSD